MSKRKIRNALEERLASFAASKSIPVMYENSSQKTPQTDHFKCYLFAGKTQDPSIGNKHQRYVGMFRVVFYSTKLNQGMAWIEDLCEELATYFPRALQLTKDSIVVHIEETPSIYAAAFESNYCFVPVEIYYRADVITN